MVTKQDEVTTARIKKITLLVPVRNEEWILNQFLRACNKFADHIILADQQSYDESKAIAEEFKNLTLINNTCESFNEKGRIELLIAEARKRFGNNCILVALDADEIPVNTAEAIKEWDSIRELDAGTNIIFSKPDIDSDRKSLVDMGPIWKLGYVDDGIEHDPQTIHAQRVPAPVGAPIYKAKHINFVHVNLIRPLALRAKRRLYCALENVNQSKPLRLRLHSYRSGIDFSAAGDRSSLPVDWKNALESDGLKLEEITENPPFWQDYEVIRLFNQYGTKRFWMDDIWDQNWQATAECLRERKWGCIPDHIDTPPFYVSLIRNVVQLLLCSLTEWVRKVKIVIS